MYDTIFPGQSFGPYLLHSSRSFLNRQYAFHSSGVNLWPGCSFRRHPTPATFATKTKAKRALTSQAYADFQVSDGVAGNALAEVQVKFPVRKMFNARPHGRTAMRDMAPSQACASPKQEALLLTLSGRRE